MLQLYARYSTLRSCTAVLKGGLKCHLIPDGMRAWRACTADYGHTGRSTWFRGIPDAPDNHSGRPGDRVWPRFPLILGSSGAQNGVGGFSGLPTSIFDFFLNGCVPFVGKYLPQKRDERLKSMAKN